MSYATPTLADPVSYIEPGEVDRVMRLHKTVRGNHLVIVQPEATAVYIRVLPTSHPSMYFVASTTNVFWGDISWDNFFLGWSCRLNGPGYRLSDNNPEKETFHATLQSAVRRARKHTENRAGEPKSNLQRWLDEIPELISPYPTDTQIKWHRDHERSYWASVADEMETDRIADDFDNRYPIIAEGDF